MRKTLYFIGFLLLLSSCVKENVSPVNLFITRSDEYGDSVSHSQYILFHIKAISNTKPISHLKCTSFDSENGIDLVFDTIFADGPMKVEYDYPLFTKYYTTTENMEVKLSFTVYTTEDETMTQVVYYHVVGNVLLTPYENIILYSGALSDKKNGLSLEWVTPIIVQTADSTETDIYDFHSLDLSPDILSREWRSKTGISFVRFNDFNFPAATIKYLQDSYLAGNKFSSISNLTNGDIVLVGRDNTAIGVFQIQAIYDEEGVENDRYELTFKKR